MHYNLNLSGIQILLPYHESLYYIFERTKSSFWYHLINATEYLYRYNVLRDNIKMVE